MSTRKSFDNDTMVALGRRIASARGERTQEEFAKIIGVSRSALANYEAGRRIPNSEIFSRIENETSVSKHVLLFGENPSGHVSQMQEMKNRIISMKESITPGMLHKFLISDQELDIIKAIREIENPSDILMKIADLAESSINKQYKSKSGAPKYGEQFVSNVRRLAKAGYFQQGFDPDRADWLTLLDEIDRGHH